MRIRKGVAAVVVGGMLAVGGAGAAFADTPSSTPAAVQQKGCTHVDQRIDRLQKRRTHVEARIDKLQQARDRARDHHRDDLADRIQHRIDKLQKVRDKLTDRIQHLRDRCGVPDATTPTTVPSAAPAA